MLVTNWKVWANDVLGSRRERLDSHPPPPPQLGIRATPVPRSGRGDACSQAARKLEALKVSLTRNIPSTY